MLTSTAGRRRSNIYSTQCRWNFLVIFLIVFWEGVFHVAVHVLLQAKWFYCLAATVLRSWIEVKALTVSLSPSFLAAIFQTNWDCPIPRTSTVLISPSISVENLNEQVAWGLFTGRMPFLLPNRQCQSTERNITGLICCWTMAEL